ncbi:hypothetical protein EGW08_009090 [Elysia chlorotica]|uniref:Uncharacterized protein n=1 Tax=Elysia chlorotica TaxID=188477 RepID=A0A433TNI6_ELYCH|nr:hypothetical protein EGW08_009090 [Elysia chlorotica]
MADENGLEMTSRSKTRPIRAKRLSNEELYELLDRSDEELLSDCDTEDEYCPDSEKSEDSSCELDDIPVSSLEIPTDSSSSIPGISNHNCLNLVDVDPAPQDNVTECRDALVPKFDIMTGLPMNHPDGIRSTEQETTSNRPTSLNVGLQPLDNNAVLSEGSSPTLTEMLPVGLLCTRLDKEQHPVKSQGCDANNVFEPDSNNMNDTPSIDQSQECCVVLPLAQTTPPANVSAPSPPSQHETNSDNVRPTARFHKRTNKELTRKRQRDPSTWKASVRKRLRQSGKDYIDSKGKRQPARTIKLKKDCTSCRFKCTLQFSEHERAKLFEDFWALDDQEKRQFYISTTQITSCQRKRTDREISRKKNSLAYFFPLNGENVRVCKTFYLSILDVSQKRIITCHATKTPSTGTPTSFKWSENSNRKVPDEIKEGIRQHIRSIPRVESHYTRKDTNKEYVSQWGMSVNGLYNEYLKQCEEKGMIAGKLHLYRHIFNTEFNIGFHFPKSDRCDRCEQFRAITEPTEEQIQNYESHRKAREETEAERNKDRKDDQAFVICFDLENVFSLPRANISSFFYKRKLSVYHMTAHCSVGGKSYGALWHEAQNGRSGNDIASAVIRLLEDVIKDYNDSPLIENIILWSDSCVPQNRNKIFSTAVKYFLNRNPQVKTITHKYCQPGHSSIQEVDNLHSRVEKACGPNEIFSPIGLLRILKRVNHLKTIQLKKEDFKDFGKIALRGLYDKVPYTKVKSLRYDQAQPSHLQYKTDFSMEWVTERVFNMPASRSKSKKVRTSLQTVIGSVKTAKPSGPLAKAKALDIKDMLKFMPEADKVYMSLLVVAEVNRK